MSPWREWYRLLGEATEQQSSHGLSNWRGHRELLARVTDAEGTWLCLREVHSKLASSISKQTWHKHIKQGEHTDLGSLSVAVVVLSSRCRFTDA